MTLNGFLALAKHFRKYFIMVSVVSVIAALLLSLSVIKTQFSAESSLSVSDPSGNIPENELMTAARSYAEDVTEDMTTDDVTVEALVYASRDPYTIVFSADTTDEELSIELANSASQETKRLLETTFDELELRREAVLQSLDSGVALPSDDSVLSELYSFTDSDDEQAAALAKALLGDTEDAKKSFDYCVFIVNEATKAEISGFSTPKLVLAALVGGLLLVVGGIALYDLVKAPLKTKEDIEDEASLPILLNGEEGNRGLMLWLKICLQNQGIPSEIALVPLAGTPPTELGASLMKAIELDKDALALKSINDASDHEVRVDICSPLSDSAQSICDAHNADVVLVVATLWKNTRRELAKTMQDMKTVGANVLGIIVSDDKKQPGAINVATDRSS